GEKDGLSTWWYENGELEQKRNWENGTLNGTSTLWYESGQKRSKGNYKEGKLISVEVVWTPNGEKCPKSNVKDGTGVIVRYHKNGKKELEVKFKNGEPIGKPRQF
ncbi:hypothetical protein N9N13_08900, partial [Opitutales bacterium]|nr:hypothetical protein [Opitutales bacterium]